MKARKGEGPFANRTRFLIGRKVACFAAGLMMAACVLVCAVLVPALSTARFENALLRTVNQQALGINDQTLSAFAEETMLYLRGQKPVWQPDVPFPVPDSFRMHMAEVRFWVQCAPRILLIGAVTAVVLFLLGGRQKRPAMLGIFTLAVLLLVLIIWAAADFHSLWMILHKTLIPNGIFSANEPVMQLFPLGLFFRYLVPVALWAAGLLAALCAAVTAAAS